MSADAAIPRLFSKIVRSFSPRAAAVRSAKLAMLLDTVFADGKIDSFWLMIFNPTFFYGQRHSHSE